MFNGAIFSIASVISGVSGIISVTKDKGAPEFRAGEITCLIIKSATLASP